MKIGVMGGAGYIGSHTVLELIKDGHDVFIVDNLSTGNKRMVNEKARFYEGDITNKEQLSKIFFEEEELGHIDAVMHFAAKLIVPESCSMPLEYYHNNVEGVRIMLEVMKENNIKNVVFSSSAAVYGEPKNGVCFETDETNPINPYGETKLASEKLIKWTCKAYDMNYCIFRYFNVAGADESKTIGLDKEVVTWIIPIATQTALGIRPSMKLCGTDYPTRDGSCVRDYVHVSDLARAHVLGVKYINEHNESLLLNLGSSEGYSVKEVLDTVNEIIPLKYEIGERRPGDPATLIANSDKAKNILGWTPKYNLKDMITSDLEFRKTLLK